MVDEKSNLHVLTVVGCGIGNDGVQLLARALEDNNTLTSLNLWCMQAAIPYRLSFTANDLDEKGIKYVAEMLTVNSTLQKLVLDCTSLSRLRLTVSDNPIGNMGAAYIAEGIASNRGLTMLCCGSTMRSWY